MILDLFSTKSGNLGFSTSVIGILTFACCFAHFQQSKIVAKTVSVSSLTSYLSFSTYFLLSSENGVFGAV